MKLKREKKTNMWRKGNIGIVNINQRKKKEIKIERRCCFE